MIAYSVGLPALAGGMAHAVPPELEQQIGQGVLERLDSRVLTDSELEAEEQEKVRAYLLANTPQGLPFEVTVHFRNSGVFGANALALPGGLIVLTDDLVELLDVQEQMLAVYLHVIGHVDGRHMIRQGLQSSLVSLLIMAATGDLTAATDIVAVLPAMLITFSFSRDFELEADRYAVRQLERLGVPGETLADSLLRLTSEGKGINALFRSEYLSTHPQTVRRIKRILTARTAR